MHSTKGKVNRLNKMKGLNRQITETKVICKAAPLIQAHTKLNQHRGSLIITDFAYIIISHKEDLKRLMMYGLYHCDPLEQ